MVPRVALTSLESQIHRNPPAFSLVSIGITSMRQHTWVSAKSWIPSPCRKEVMIVYDSLEEATNLAPVAVIATIPLYVVP